MMRDVYSLRDQLPLLDYDSAITSEDFKTNFKRTKEKANFLLNGRDGKVRTATVYRTTIPCYEDVRFVKVLDETSRTDADSPFDSLWLVDVLKATARAKPEKEFTIAMHRRGFMGHEGSVSTVTGTLDFLLRHFAYTLECGRSWEHERGRRKVNMNPKTGRSLVTALNNAKNNSARNGYSDTWFEIVENPIRQQISGMDEYAKLVKAEQTCHTIEVREKATGKEGVANTCPDGVQVFYGADDGSDDKTISAGDFSRDFEITAMLDS